MSIRDEISTDIYRKMVELQEKLRQSEAERIQLKEMLTVLVKTYGEEEDIRLKSLENRYQMFLEDCARRSYRNEKILRSVERVESGANALHAKTERLKLLRNHYEAYLERVISTWRHPSLLRCGPTPLPSTQEFVRNRRNQLIAEESTELVSPDGHPLDKSGRPSSGNTFEYFSHKLPNDYMRSRHGMSFQDGRNNVDENYLNYMTGELIQKEKIIHNHDISYKGDDVMHFGSAKDIPSKGLVGRFDDEFVNDEILGLKGLESSLHHKLSLGSRSNLSRELFHQRDTFVESAKVASSIGWGDADHVLNKLSKANASQFPGGKHWFSDRRIEPIPHEAGDFDKICIDGTPKITREPVEIKKPEIIVGKISPEISLKSDYFNKGQKVQDHSPQNFKSAALFKSSNASTDKIGKKIELESDIIDAEVRTVSPHEKWSLLKHRRTIDKLKENLSYEKEHEQNMDKGNKLNEKVEVEPTNAEESRKEEDDTDLSQGLSEAWRTNGDEIISTRLMIQSGDREIEPQNDSEQFRTDIKSETVPSYEHSFQEVPHTDISNQNEEVYEDNEEAYPDSYFEQPSKSDYSRDIVSNVILEEDENEVNTQDELSGDLIQDQGNMQESNTYEQPQYHVAHDDNLQSSYNGFSAFVTGETKCNENEYPNFQPSDSGYNDGNMYEANYSDIRPQDEYSYINQDVNNYNTNNMQEYNTMEQYPESADTQHYYESHHSGDQGNYVSEEMVQGEENFDSAYKQSNNYKNNRAVEQYIEDDGSQQEYSQGHDGNYYNDGEYQGFYQSHQEQNAEYSSKKEQENVGYTETTGYENVGMDGGDGYGDENNRLPLRQSNLSHLLDSDTESFQMEHGSAPANEDSDFDFSMNQQQ